MPRIPTVKIKDGADYIVINADRYDPKQHTLYDPDEAAKVIAERSNIGTDSGDQFSDDQLRDAIENATGKRPHPNAKRATLIGKFNELNQASG